MWSQGEYNVTVSTDGGSLTASSVQASRVQASSVQADGLSSPEIDALQHIVRDKLPPRLRARRAELVRTLLATASGGSETQALPAMLREVKRHAALSDRVWCKNRIDVPKPPLDEYCSVPPSRTSFLIAPVPHLSGGTIRTFPMPW